MAASSAPQGYQCEFIDSVPEDFYCKQCSLVARKLTITSCCGESYCNACIHSTQQDNKPCPGCGTQDFQTQQQVKYQKKILNFQVLCSLKKRGCGWCGPLEHLDTHLDPDTGDCEYTDIDCPLKCHNKISKNNISHHLANECVKRDYVCPHCAFKASYEIVCNIHWPECSYFPLTCPNRCGVTCERTTMEEDHMKICPLQEVECELKHIGCAERFLREDEEEHMRENAQTHLLMMATTLSQDFQGKLQEQERKSQEQERKSQEQERKLQEQERKLQEQERKLQEQERKLQEQERKLQEQERKLQEQERKSQEQEEKFEEMLVVQHKESEEKMKALKTEIAGLFWSFSMDNFSEEKAKDEYSDWKSPPMYTHMCGYKFCVGIDANGCGSNRGKSVNVDLWAMKGEYDDQLKWPVTAKFTLELINHFEGGENMNCTLTTSWKKSIREYKRIAIFYTTGLNCHFISHTELPCKPATRKQFLKNDTLYFKITNITIS